VAVPLVEGQRQPLAVRRIRDAGFKPRVIGRSNETVARGIVFDQEPDAGERIQKGNIVRIIVSTGKPRVEVPDVVGAREADALPTLRAAGLVPDAHDIFSDQPSGTVIAQDPKGGTSVVKGSTVRVNISKGQETTGLPNVIGLSFDSGAEQLRRSGFTPIRRDVDSTEPAGTVIDMTPGPGTLQPPGTKVTLNVSNGNSTTSIPDVRGLDEATAQANLENDGWVVQVSDTPTDNPDEDGVVLSQTPTAGEQKAPGTRVTIFVGRFTGGDTETTPTTPTPVTP
jgi:serine/threonine-protein kinase